MRDFDPVLEAEGLLEDPHGEIEASLAGLGRRFFKAVAEADGLAGDLLKDTRRHFAYTVDFPPPVQTNDAHEEERSRLLLFVEDDLTFRGCKAARAVLAFAAQAAHLDEVGIVDCRDDSVLLLVHREAFRRSQDLWSEKQLGDARIALRSLVAWEQQT